MRSAQHEMSFYLKQKSTGGLKLTSAFAVVLSSTRPIYDRFISVIQILLQPSSNFLNYLNICIVLKISVHITLKIKWFNQKVLDVAEW
jgi:hypothetical protein